MLPEMDERIQAAAETIEQALVEVHKDDRGVHVNTLICTCAAILGEAVQRICMTDEQLYGDRGILYNEATDYWLWGADDGNVIDFIAFTAGEVGLTPERMPDIDVICRTTIAAMGKAEIPALTVPDDQRPQFWSMAGATFMRKQMLEIYQRFDLKADEALLAMTLTLCRFLNATQNVLKPEIGFRLALETLIGSVRLHPVSQEDLDRMTQKPQ